MRKRLGVYDKQEFDKLVDLIKREGTSRFNAKRLLRHLQEIIWISGYPLENTDEARIWRGISEDDDLPPKVAIEHLDRMLVAENPLEQEQNPSILEARLNAKLRTYWEPRWKKERRDQPPRVSTIIWNELSETERKEIREMITDIRCYFASMITIGAPRKSVLDTILEEIAQLWADQISWNGDYDDLPHSENSRFMQFATIALAPLAHGTETSQRALARRWQRMKNEQSCI